MIQLPTPFSVLQAVLFAIWFSGGASPLEAQLAGTYDGQTRVVSSPLPVAAQFVLANTGSGELRGKWTYWPYKSPTDTSRQEISFDIVGQFEPRSGKLNLKVRDPESLKRVAQEWRPTTRSLSVKFDSARKWILDGDGLVYARVGSTEYSFVSRNLRDAQRRAYSLRGFTVPVTSAPAQVELTPERATSNSPDAPQIIAAVQGDTVGIVRRPELDGISQFVRQMRGACSSEELSIGFEVLDAARFQGNSSHVLEFVRGIAAEASGTFIRMCPKNRLYTVRIFANDRGVPLAVFEAYHTRKFVPVLLQSYYTEMADPPVTISPFNTLKGGIEDRGYLNAKLIHRNDRYESWLTNLERTGAPLIVIIHNIGAAEPILDFRLYSALGMRYVTGSVDANYISQFIAPTLSSPVKITVAHYVNRFHLPYALRLDASVSRGFNLELPLLVTEYSARDRGPYDPEESIRSVESQRRFTYMGGDNLLLNSAQAISRFQHHAGIEGSVTRLEDKTSPYFGGASPPLGTTHVVTYPPSNLGGVSRLVGFRPRGAGPIVSDALAAFTRKQKQKRSAAIAAGYVYKSPIFWGEAPYGRLSEFFEGEPRWRPDAPILAMAVDAYVRARWSTCPSEFTAVDGTFSVTKTIVTFQGYREIARTSYTSDYLRVEKRLTPIYGYYVNARGIESSGDAILQKMKEIATNPDMFIREQQAMGSLYLGLRADARWLLSELGCRSAIVAQLAENLYRMATGAPTVQEAKFRVAGASAATDPEFAPGQPRSLKQACLEASSNGGPYNELENGDSCRCISDQLTPLLTDTERRQFLADIDALWRFPLSRVGTHAGDIYERVSSCKR